MLWSAGAVTDGENGRRAVFIHEHQDGVAGKSPKPVAANGQTLRSCPDDCAYFGALEG